ncbi:hypothetical protein YPPY48_3039, partial [Yersinia pestis PY-48]
MIVDNDKYQTLGMVS